MIDFNQTLKKGTLLVIETGEYSDRNWDGPVQMTKDALKADLVAAFREQWKPDYEGDTYGPSPNDFLPWLIKEGYAKHVDNVHVWHVGSYGSFEP